MHSSAFRRWKRTPESSGAFMSMKCSISERLYASCPQSPIAFSISGLIVRRIWGGGLFEVANRMEQPGVEPQMVVATYQEHHFPDHVRARMSEHIRKFPLPLFLGLLPCDRVGVVVGDEEHNVLEPVNVAHEVGVSEHTTAESIAADLGFLGPHVSVNQVVNVMDILTPELQKADCLGVPEAQGLKNVFGVNFWSHD